MNARVEFTKFHAAQEQMIATRSKRDVYRCGRRFGKTTLLEQRAGNWALKKKYVGWFCPTYKLQIPTYNRLHKMLGDAIARSSKVDGIIELKTGGSIEFWTLNDEDAGRSRKYHEVIIDEASLVKNLQNIWEQSIEPTLLDYNGSATMAGTPKGIDDENFFYLACSDKKLGWQEFHRPTASNPMLDPVAVAALSGKVPPLVYQQEYLAEFVDWSGAAFFSLDKLLHEGQAVSIPQHVDCVFAIIDSATKTGTENDGTAVLYCSLSKYHGHPVVLLDWDIVQIEGALLETWLPSVFQNLERLSLLTKSRMGVAGVHIEDKSSGMILLQQARRRNLDVHSIDSKLTSVGKDERAISVSGYVFRNMVKISQPAFDKTVTFKGLTRNHLVTQVCGFRIGDKEAAKRADDLLDTFTYGVAIALGNDEGF